MLPRARSSSPLLTPAILAASSGKLVPSAIIVSPITKSLTPKYAAINTALSTKKCALRGNITSPIMTHITALMVGTSEGISSSVSAIKGSFFSTLKDSHAMPASTNTNRVIRVTPSIWVNSLSDKKITAMRVITSRIGNSRFSVVEETTSGFNTAVNPNTRAILVIFEPSELPTAVSGFPARDAVAETTISGALDPMATMVRPIIIGDTPRFFAKADAP